MFPPNEQRNFVHKRIIGAVGGALTGGIGGAFTGFVSGGGGGSSRRGGSPNALAVTRDPCPQAGTQMGTRGCYNPRTQNRDGSPRGGSTPTPGVLGAVQRLLPGGASGFSGGGAVMGQYGAALQPFVDVREVRTCLPGMVLGKDGLCYNRRDISNKEREWPKGTRPLGTPGEMAALRKAASFGRRMETTVKRMQKIGVLKKPSRGGRRSSAPRPRQLTAGPSIINVE